MIRRHYNRSYFTIPTVENCYWGGFLAADGCVSVKYNSVKLTLAAKDRDHVEAFKAAVSYDGGLVYSAKTNSYSVQLYGAEQFLYDLENNFNVVGNKSLTLKPPTQLAHCGLELEKAFLVGFMDGDGCIRYDKRDGLLHLDVFSGSLRMVDWAKEFIERVYSLPDKRVFCNSNGRGFLYRLIGKSAEVVLADLGRSHVPKLSRKWDPVKPVRQPRDRRVS